MNKVTLVGRVVGRTSVTTDASGTPTLNVQIFTEEISHDKGYPERHEQWHRIRVVGKGCEVYQRYLVKGAQIAVDGKLRTMEDTDGKGIFIRAEHMDILSTPKSVPKPKNDGTSVMRNPTDPQSTQILMAGDETSRVSYDDDTRKV